MIIALTILGFALIFGVANRIWGGDYFPGGQYVCIMLIMIASGLGFYYLHHLDWLHSSIYGLITGILFLLGRVWAISNYFCCFNPALKPDMSRGELWINDVCNKEVPVLDTDAKVMRWGTVGMILRGVYFFPFLGPLFPLFGLIYASMRYLPYNWWVAQRQVPIAESLSGSLIGISYGVIFSIFFL